MSRQGQNPGRQKAVRAVRYGMYILNTRMLLMQVFAPISNTYAPIVQVGQLSLSIILWRGFNLLY